jgi:hypothetical protein
MVQRKNQDFELVSKQGQNPEIACAQTAADIHTAGAALRSGQNDFVKACNNLLRQYTHKKEELVTNL